MGSPFPRSRHRTPSTLAALGLAVCAATAEAVPFVSDGSDGAFAPLANTTIDLAALGNGGVFNFTTIDIPEHVTVRFVGRASNPAVVFGATGDVDIAGTVVVSASGQTGGPGGGEGGRRGIGDNVTALDGTGVLDGPGRAGVISIAPDPRFGRGGAGGGGGNARAGGTATSRTGPLRGAGGARVAPQANIIGGSGGGGGSGSLFFGVDHSGGAGGGAGGGLQISTPGTIDVSGALLADGAHGGTGFATNNAGPGGGGSGGNFELNAGLIAIDATATIRAIGGAGGGLSSESCTVTDPYRCSTFANGGLGYLILDGAAIDVAPGAGVFAQPVGASLPGFSVDDPLLPGAANGPGTWTFDPIEVLPTAFGGFLGPSLWVDPDVAVGYDYAVADARIASVELPFGFGDDVFEIWLRNPASGAFEFVQSLAAGERLDLNGLDPFGNGPIERGVDVLRVLGIEISEGVDPLAPDAFPTGLTFVAEPGVGLSPALTANLTMTALTEFVAGDPGDPAVPAPSSLLCVALGLGGVWITRRRRGRPRA